MADISKIKTLNGTTYNIKDAVARTSKVNGPSSSNNGTVALFNGTTGKTIKDSGLTIGRSIPADAVFLPTVTTSDNGKVLRVVNGAWAAVSLPSASGVSF